MRIGTNCALNVSALASGPYSTDLAMLDELAWLEDLFARYFFSWARMDTYATPVGGQVASWTDRVYLPKDGGLANNARSIDANHAFVQPSAPSQVVVPAKSAITANREAASFTMAQFYKSSLFPSAWRFAHDGTGSFILLVGANGDAVTSTTGVSASTGTQPLTGTGCNLYTWCATSDQRHYVLNAGAQAVPFATMTPFGTSLTFTYATLSSSLSPQWKTQIRSSGSSRSGSVTIPASGDPSFTMTLGCFGDGTFKSNGLLCEALFANQVPSTAMLNNIFRYLFLRYAGLN